MRLLALVEDAYIMVSARVRKLEVKVVMSDLTQC